MVVSLVVVMSSCDDSEDISEQDSVSGYSVRMGGIFPFSGALSDQGKARHHAALLAIKHLAEAGYPVGWAVADSETNPDTGEKAARKLIEQGKVQVLIGAASSGVTIAIAEYIQTILYPVPQISPSSTSTEITTLADQDFLFRVAASDTLQGIALAQLAYDTNYRNLSVLYVDNFYGQGLKKIFTDNFNALGGTTSFRKHEEVVDPEIAKETYRQKLEELYNTGATEALVAMGYTRHAKVYIQEAIDNSYFKNFLFVDGNKSKDIIESVGAENLAGMCGTAAGVNKKTNSWREFKKSYQAEYSEAPTVVYQSHTYDAIIIAGLAAYAAQASGEEVTPITIRNYLRYVAGPDGEIVGPGLKDVRRAMKILDSGLTINYEGASGNVDFDKNGDVITPIEIWCYKSNGEMEPRELCEINNPDQLLPDAAEVNCNKIVSN
jgi:branched-chain amino acid transport system substrate-binding protein